MIGTAVARYQEVRIQTVTPGELLIALYDGLFRFLAGAKHCFENKQRGKAGEFVSKSHAVLSELLLALDTKQHPELCANLTSVYTFCLTRLTSATITGDPEKVADVIRVLTPLREAWRIAVPKSALEQAQGKTSG